MGDVDGLLPYSKNHRILFSQCRVRIPWRNASELVLDIRLRVMSLFYGDEISELTERSVKGFRQSTLRITGQKWFRQA